MESETLHQKLSIGETAEYIWKGLHQLGPLDETSAYCQAEIQLDQVSAYFEATELAGFSDKEARSFFGQPRGITKEQLLISPQETVEVEALFLHRFNEIEAARKNAPKKKPK